MEELGAGDQGITFGYACDETSELMPATLVYAHRLMERQAQLRKSQRLPFLLLMPKPGYPALSGIIVFIQ